MYDLTNPDPAVTSVVLPSVLMTFAVPAAVCVAVGASKPAGEGSAGTAPTPGPTASSGSRETGRDSPPSTIRRPFSFSTFSTFAAGSGTRF